VKSRVRAQRWRDESNKPVPSPGDVYRIARRKASRIKYRKRLQEGTTGGQVGCTSSQSLVSLMGMNTTAATSTRGLQEQYGETVWDPNLEPKHAIDRLIHALPPSRSPPILPIDHFLIFYSLIRWHSTL
jgi:hypothetical protein